MAKVIKYKFLSCEVNHGTDEAPEMEQIFLEKTMCWNEVNEAIAAKEAYGEITPYDNGKPEPEQQHTPEQRIAELEAALEMLLSGVTE